MTSLSEFSPRRRSLLVGGLGTASAAALAPLTAGGPAAAATPAPAASAATPAAAAATPAAAAADFDFDTGNFVRELIAPFQPAQNVADASHAGEVGAKYTTLCGPRLNPAQARLLVGSWAA